MVAALDERGLTERASISTMEVSSLRVLRRLDPGLRLGWTVPKVTRDWNSVRWAKPVVIAGLISLRRRLPGEVRRRAPDLGVRSIWAYDPVITPRLARACHEAGLELIAWTVDDARGCDGSPPRGSTASHQRPAAVRRVGPVTGGPARDADRVEPGTAVALIAMGLGVIVIANDFTALNVALPAIEEDLNVDLGTAQWVINAYCLGVRDGDRHRRSARRPVRAPPRLLRRQRPVRRVLAAGRSGPGRAVADRRQGGHGPRRRADLAGDPRHDLRRPAGIEGRAGRRADPGRRRPRQRDGPAARRAAHRRAELALDLLPERPDRRLRRPRHLAQGPSATSGGGEPARSTTRAS